MKIAQAQYSGDQIKAVPLEHHFEPLPLDAAVRAMVAQLLSPTPGRSIEAAIAQARNASGPTTPGLAADPIGGSPVSPATSLSKDFRITPLAIDWSKPLLYTQSLYSPLSKIPLPSTPAAPPVSTTTKTGLIPVGPGTWIKPLPVSDQALENIGHAVALGQIGMDGWSELAKTSTLAPQLGMVTDEVRAGLAICEVYQQVARPRAMTRWKKVFFYLKRGFYIFKGVSHLIPGTPNEALMLVGVIVQACDKGSDEIYAMRVKSSRE